MLQMETCSNLNRFWTVLQPDETEQSEENKLGHQQQRPEQEAPSCVCVAAAVQDCNGKGVEWGRRLTEDEDGATREETTRSTTGKKAGRDERVRRGGLSSTMAETGDE
jgi:hypothetical protein